MPHSPDVETACTQAHHAFAALSELPPESRAAILDTIAAALDARRNDILATCSEETALTIDELTPEFARMTGTLRMFAQVVREGSWVRAAIDTHVMHSPRGHAGATAAAQQPAPNNPGVTAGAPSLIGPNHDIRSMLVPLGPVAVFGSSNFPLAYGVCGGDTASALAAGCPVIIKEHPAHPKTGRLIADIAHHAIGDTMARFRDGDWLPAAFSKHTVGAPDIAAELSAFAKEESVAALKHLLGYVRNEDPTDLSIAQSLVRHWGISGVGFTGSTRAGLALADLAQKRKEPIPVFAEMGSLNCMFIWPAAFANRGEAIANEIAASVLARVGQQCTKPGVVFIPGNDAHWTLHKMICERLLTASSRRMLSRTVADNYYRRLDVLAASQGILENTPLPTLEQRAEALGVPVVFAAGDIAMEDAPEVWEETFGPAIIIARSSDSAWNFAPGALTVTIYADPDDINGTRPDLDNGNWDSFWYRYPRIARAAGRIILNGVPTGVRVATSMVHGGPFPSTNAPHTTAVGPRAIERWCRPLCYQNCPDALLSPELQNANPRAIWRTINGSPTKSAVS